MGGRGEPCDVKNKSLSSWDVCMMMKNWAQKGTLYQEN